MRHTVFVVLVLCSLSAAVAAAQPDKTAPKITISVDASEAPRKIFHARLTIEASPGPLTLYYPKWLPGEHAPTGPIEDLAGLKFFANGKEIPWQRDLVDMYALHCDVPQDASSVEVRLDYLSPAEAEGFSSGASATEKLTLVSWNQLLLYPKGWKAADIIFTPSLKLPAGWKYGTALQTTGESGDGVQFAPVPLVTLIDSPVLSGEYFARIALKETDPKVYLDAAADSAAALEITPEEVTHLKNLVAETGALFGATHYRHYDFLLTLSNHTAHFGLEHHESSDDRTNEGALVDEDLRRSSAGLMPHEMTHSWNGKYRRPAGLATPDYQQPMVDDLLWVYEGLTTYLGNVFTARSRLWTPDEYRDDLAMAAAEMDRDRPGRAWRNVLDTAVDAQDTYGNRTRAWGSWRRSTDFYAEGALIWLEADTIIRNVTQGKKSIDDFCKLFYGLPSGPPEVVPYSFDQLVTALNQVAPYDWRTFFNQRLHSHGPEAPLGGIENSGWRLVFTDTPSAMHRVQQRVRHTSDFRYSLGFILDREDVMTDVVTGSPAYNAGLGPGMVLVAVNGRKYESAVLYEAIRAAQSNNAAPLELLVRNGDYFRTFKIDYHEGNKYPHLERNQAKPDLLSDIIRPHAQ
ncbi:MAG TPA: M61 family peptidase [Terriglobales bacterium]|nr:M61 family peptidase [Terriglobales bacterium]